MPMVLLPGVFPPSRATWEFVTYWFQWFPIFTAPQWVSEWYPAGKTSIESKLNLPGKWAWAIMETPGFVIILYCMFTLPQQLNLGPLPWANWTMASIYTVHYLYRAWLYTYLQPSMSPIHIMPFLGAVAFNTFNGLSLGGWLAGYGPTTNADWAGDLYRIEIGLVIWGWSWLGNMFHDDDLREIRRSALRQQQEKARKEGKPVEGVDKVYMIPKNGLFHFILYPHYLCEWFEWAGFWLIGGAKCGPARTFLINEIATMTPRALQGKRWYLQKFGKERVGSRKAIIPGLL